MKPSEIQVGKTYSNKSGTTYRKVLKIGRPPEVEPPKWWGQLLFPAASVVEYELIKGRTTCLGNRLFLTSFAAWAKKEVV